MHMYNINTKLHENIEMQKQYRKFAKSYVKDLIY